MASRDRKPVDIVLDAALRHTLHGLGFQSRSKNARYFKLPRDGFEWFVAFGPGPSGLEREGFTDATCIHSEEVAKLYREVWGAPPMRPLRIRHEAIYLGSIEMFAEEARDRKRDEHEARSGWYRLLNWMGDKAHSHEIKGNKLRSNLFWPLYGFGEAFTYVPKGLRPHMFEQETPCYYGRFSKRKPFLSKVDFYDEFHLAYESPAGKGHYWDSRGRDLTDLGLYLDECWWRHCRPVVSELMDIGQVAARYFPVDTHEFGTGPYLGSVFVHHVAGNTQAVRDVLDRVIGAGKYSWEQFVGIAKHDVGPDEFDRVRATEYKFAFLRSQWEARRKNAQRARKIADALGVRV